jgi:hypothetical protein
MDYIACMDQTQTGAWEIYGALGFRRYYGYTKKDAARLYVKECCEKEKRNEISQKYLLYVI